MDSGDDYWLPLPYLEEIQWPVRPDNAEEYTLTCGWVDRYTSHQSLRYRLYMFRYLRRSFKLPIAGFSIGREMVAQPESWEAL